MNYISLLRDYFHSMGFAW